jgi:DNA mismatch repair ATPase MutS
VIRVVNDFLMEGQGATCVITGSNMAGKSTFLRTVGINAVLAFAGAPVCADAFVLSQFHIFSSMRTKDNLEENISSFYAELLRLKMLLEHINVDKPVFYLLDEILKGTNSVDRHIGAESLILQLNGMNTFGLVSTHDLELGKLAKSNQKIINYNFSSSIIDEEIVFDYKLRAGICQSTNASQLMANIGIQIKSK